MTRTRQLVLFSVCAGALLAGCGGSARTHAPTPAYIAQANAICHRQLAQLNQLARPTTTAQAVAFLPSALAILHHESRMLTAVDAPPGERDRFTTAVAGTRQLADLLERLLGELRGGTVEFAVLTSVQTQSAALRARFDARFREAGMVGCDQ